MAKFCGNCGAQMEDSAKVCGNCGIPFGVAANNQSVSFVDPEKKKRKTEKMKKAVKLFLGLIAMILVAVIVLNVVTEFTGYKGLLRKVMAAYEDYDIEALVNLSSDMYYYGSGDYAENYFEDAVGYALDSFEDNVGHSYKLSYVVDETYTLSNRNLDSLLSDISWMYSEFDIGIIEKIVVANITVTARQGNKSINRELEITMSKENGKWTLLYID